MDVIDAIKTRRSIRRYTGGVITGDQIETLLTAAMYAPSARNQQPWQFMVVTNRQRMLDIMNYHPHARMLQEAACAIIICGDTRITTRTEYWPVDCAAATQNLLLAAHGTGLGAVWLGVYPVPERMDALTRLFNLPAGVFPFAVISVGLPAETPPQPNRYMPERIHYENWHHS